MFSSGQKRFILATTITGLCALYTACVPQRQEPQTIVAEVPAADLKVLEENTAGISESTASNDSQTQKEESNTTESENASDSEDAASTEEKALLKFPIPTEADGAALLQYENISFEADTTPMPDIAATVRSARKNSDASSMFITHMMYRDKIGDIAYYNNGKKQETELSEAERHREMIRWRDAAYDANFELAMLATNPSVVYETSPLFSDDEEYQKSISWLKKAAARGYGNAEYILGLVYFNGVGIKRDKKKGFELLVRAAAHGVINAYYAVGMIYEMGLNGKKDTDKSLYWLEKAVHFGSKDATFILAMKYYDGIDVPKDEDKAHALEKLDPTYHAWIKLINAGFYHKYCTFRFDESAIGWTKKEHGGECGEDVTISHYNSAGFDEDKDDYSLEETAASSLDYKIDYRLAAQWLRKAATFERDYSYILHAQTHHITGCRGDLDGHSYGDIILYPDEYDEYDYDGYPDLYQKYIIALTDDKIKPSKLKKMLMNKVEEGDPDAMNLLGNLYNQPDVIEDEEEDDDYDDDNISNGYEYLYEPLGIKENIPKALEYFEKAFNINEERCKTEPNNNCSAFDNDMVDAAISMADKAYTNKKYDTAYEWYEKAFYFSIRAKNDWRAVRTTDIAAKQNNLKNHEEIKKLWYPQIIDSCKERYEALNQTPDNTKNRMDEALKIARYYKKLLEDDAQAKEWYKKYIIINIERYEALDKKHAKETIEQASKIADFYHELLEDDTHAIEWYEKAFQVSVQTKNHEKAITAAKEIARLAAQNKQHNVEMQWYKKIIDLCIKRYETLEHVQDNTNTRFDEAVRTAGYYHKMGDDPQAIEWYNKALEEGGKNNKINTTYVQRSLANLYYTTDSTQVQDKAKAAQIDKDYLSNRSEYRTTEDYNAAFRLCEFNYLNKQSPNLPLAIEACKTAIEIYYLREYYGDFDNEKDIKFVREVVDKMPRIDLINEVEKQIQAEKGKTPDKFFVIEKVLIPCETDYEYEDYGDEPEYRCDSIKPFYTESIKKAMIAITALNLASGSLNLDEIRNTFYYLAIYKGKDKKYREQLSNDSAVYDAFKEGEYSDAHDYHLSSENKEQLFYTWYLRQIPYAASDRFKTLNATKTWKEYTKEAKELLKKDEQLRTAFGYDLMKYTQGFVDPDAPKK